MQNNFRELEELVFFDLWIPDSGFRIPIPVSGFRFPVSGFRFPGFRVAHWKTNSPLWKRVIAWERSRAASGYGIIWGDADRNKQEEFSAECHSVDCF